MNTDRSEVLNDLARQVPEPEFAHSVRRRSRRIGDLRRVAAATLVAVSIGAVAWSDGSVRPQNYQSGGEEQLSQSENPFATYEGRALMLANLRARLVFDDGCVYLGRTPLLVPSDTHWDPTRQELTLDGETLRVGEMVSVGGGFVRRERADHIPSSCRFDRDVTRPFWQLGTFEH